MSIKEVLLNDMKEAMKRKDALAKNAIQMVRGAILQKEKDELREISEDEIMDIIAKQVKMRRDAIVEFERGDRNDLVEEAQKEVQVLLAYLPKQLSDDEIQVIVEETIAEVGAVSAKDMGKVMGALLPKLKGRADNSKVSQIVKTKLN